MRDAHQNFEADKSMLPKRNNKNEKLSLKTRHFTDDHQNVGRLRERVTVQTVKQGFVPAPASQSTKGLKAMTPDHISLRSELNALHAAEGFQEGVLHVVIITGCMLQWQTQS